MFDKAVIDAFAEHAREAVPHEACGLIVKDGAGAKYVPCKNAANDTHHDFKIMPAEQLAAGDVLAVVHSHPMDKNPETKATRIYYGPSSNDLKAAEASAVPWGITTQTPMGWTPVYFWGPGVPIPPLTPRQFRHGPSGSDGRGDCYALIKDAFKLKLNVDLPEGYRDDLWWKNGGDLYHENMARAGFTRIEDGATGCKPYDVVLMKIYSKVANHGGVYMGNELLLHHPANELSREEPIGRYLKLIGQEWWRHKSQL